MYGRSICLPGCNLMHFILAADVLGQILGVSKQSYVCMSTNTSDIAKRVITLRDDRLDPCVVPGNWDVKQYVFTSNYICLFLLL
jgi:uncharacterized protein YjaG (DUF416 family)